MDKDKIRVICWENFKKQIWVGKEYNVEEFLLFWNDFYNNLKKYLG